MTIIGNKLYLKLHGDTEEETLELINENRKKICELLVRAYDENNQRRMDNFIGALDQLESFAESIGEKEEPDSSINGEPKKLCKSIVKAAKRRDRKGRDELNEHLFNLSKLASTAYYIEKFDENKVEFINRLGFHATVFKPQ